MILVKWLVPIFLVVAGGAFIALAIQSTLDDSTTVTGHIVNVESASVTTFSELVIEDGSGSLWTFTGSGHFSGFTPSHLEEHRSLNEPVTIRFSELEDGQLRILAITD